VKTAHRIVAVTLLAVAGIVSVARAENADLQDLLSGKRVPLALKLKDLDSTWRRVRVTTGSEVGPLAIYAQLLGGGAGAYYTKGEIVLLAGNAYIIAYQPPSKSMDTTEFFRGGTPPEPEPLTTETTLALALIQLRTAGSLTDIRPFDLDQEIAEQAGVRKALEGARGKAVNQNSLNNLKQIGLVLAMYADDHKGKLPDLSDPQSMKKALTKYISDEKIFVYPKTGEPYLPNSSLSGQEWQGTNIDNVVVYEAKPADNGTRAVLFCDGHCERVTEARWLELKKSSNIP
jgi:prepilin-type processing-associated H-X9-DG protein